MGSRKKARTARSAAYGKGSIYQDKTGQWWYQPPPHERRRLPRVRAADEKGAILAQKDHLAKREAKVDLNAPTVNTWLDFWLREHVTPGLKPKTIEWYRYLIEHYVLPAIGDIALDNLNADQLIVLQNQLRGHLTDRTVNRIMALVNRALKKAVKSRKLLYNPAEAIDLPRVPRKAQRAFTVEQEQAFRAAVAGHRLELLYDLGFLHGLRRGELLGLLISEYDAAAGTIKVSGQIQTIAGETKRHSSPKTENGVRELPITPRQQELLDAHLARLRDDRARIGMEWHEHGLLFPSEVGTPIIPRNLSRHYYAVLQRAGLPKMPLHWMRHTAATRLDSRQVRASEACKAAILGHGPRSVTGGYIHVPIDEKREALTRAEVEMLKRAA
jgi:integrase